MKDIKRYIIESIKTVNEELDTDNLLWKINMWFRKKPAEYKEFIEIVKKCIENKTVTKELLEEFVNTKKFKLKQFIDFLDDDINNQDNISKDYMYLLKKVIECLMNDKQFEI